MYIFVLQTHTHTHSDLYHQPLFPQNHPTSLKLLIELDGKQLILALEKNQ